MGLIIASFDSPAASGRGIHTHDKKIPATSGSRYLFAVSDDPAASCRESCPVAVQSVLKKALPLAWQTGQVSGASDSQVYPHTGQT